MSARLHLIIVLRSLALVAAGFLASCASSPSSTTHPEQEVTLAQVSEPARATVSKEVAGGQVNKITREIERGKTVYDVEATVDGKHMECLIADKDGELLGTEVPTEFSQLPEAVRTAAEKYFGSSTGLTAMKGVEYGETQYEIEGPKHGKTVEVTFDSAGRRAK